MTALAVIAAMIAVFAAVQAARHRRAIQGTRDALLAERAFIQRLRELAWDNRELDDALARVIIDEIRNHTEKNRSIHS